MRISAWKSDRPRMRCVRFDRSRIVVCSRPERSVPSPVTNHSGELTVTCVKAAGKATRSVVVFRPNGQVLFVAQNCRTSCTATTIEPVPGRLALTCTDPSVTRLGVAVTVWCQRTTAPFEAVKPPLIE